MRVRVWCIGDVFFFLQTLFTVFETSQYQHRVDALILSCKVIQLHLNSLRKITRINVTREPCRKLSLDVIVNIYSGPSTRFLLMKRAYPAREQNNFAERVTA